MAQTVLGVFTARDDVEDVVAELQDEGFNPKDVSIVMRNLDYAQEMKESTGADVAAGAVSGATAGALLGGLAGLVSAIAFPGIGAFFIGGPLATALGLTGAAATTVSGAAAGALAGGLLGGLMNLGLSEDEARYYEERVNQGAILVAVPAADQEVSIVKEIFEDYGSSDIKTIRTERETTRNFHTDQADYTYHPSRFATLGTKGGKAKRRRNRRRQSSEEVVKIED